MTLPHEKPLEQRYAFEGKLVRIRVDRAVFPNGKECTREVCEHCGGVGILPVDAEGNVYLVRQYRYAYDEELLEIPAGKMDVSDTETHLACGIRELKEETGFTAAKMQYLGQMYPSPGFLTEVLHVYLATGLEQGSTNFDEDEYLGLVKMPFSELCRRIHSGEIKDGKTIFAAFRAQEYLK